MSSYPVSVLVLEYLELLNNFYFPLPICQFILGVGKEGDYTYRYTVTTSMASSSDEIRSNTWLTVRDRVTRECLPTTTFGDRGEPRRNRT